MRLVNIKDVKQSFMEKTDLDEETIQSIIDELPTAEIKEIDNMTVPLGVDTRSNTFVEFDTFKNDKVNGFVLGTKSSGKFYTCEKCGAYLGASVKLYASHMREVHEINVLFVDAEMEYEELAKELSGEVIN